MLRPRNARLAGLGFALVAGYLWTGHYLYSAPLGLDASAYPAGEAIQAVALAANPELKNAVAGAVWILLSLLGISAVVFFLVRSAVRSRVAEVDPARRRFLTGAGSGVGAALGSILVAGGAAAARASTSCWGPGVSAAKTASASPARRSTAA